MKIDKKNFVLFSLAIIFAGFFLFQWQKVDKWVVGIAGRTVEVELATNDQDRIRGLSGRDYLCSECGMLFKFESSGKHAFWMKGMKFPLDILWFRNGKVVHMERNIPSDFAETMIPDQEADSVLELNAGKIDEWGIRNGDDVIY